MRLWRLGAAVAGQHSRPRRKQHASSRRDTAVARHRNLRRGGRQSHTAQLHHSCKRAGDVHYRRRQPDRHRYPRLQGERERAKDCRSLARYFTLKVPPAPAACRASK